jgi:predicted AlkP superfamily phosphohydrolase/phosphomutase
MERRLKLLVVGLDGATFDIIGPMVAEGQLPTLQRLISEGASGPLRSTIPPVSAPAWSTFMTGLNPGKHGIFQWRTYDPRQYTCLDEKLMTSARLMGRTFWDVLGQDGYRVAAITVPMTYPVWPTNGFMVAGYPCPDTQRNYTFPPVWADQLTERYNFSADFYLHAPLNIAHQRGLEMLERRASLAIRCIDVEHAQVCVVVFQEIDRAQHDFWKYRDSAFPAYYTEEGKQFRNVIADNYRAADAQLARLLQWAGDETLVIVMSDHGGGPHPPRLFHTNAWLRQMGWLQAAGQASSGLSNGLRSLVSGVRKRLTIEDRLRRALPQAVIHGVRRLSLNIAAVDWGRTQAYRFPMYHPAEGIEINVRGRQPQGIVKPGAEFEALRARIIEGLRQLRDPETGAAIVREVYRREDLYSGPYADIAPDVVFLTEPKFRADAGLYGQFAVAADLGALDRDSGRHTAEGIFIANGKMVLPGQVVPGMNIADVAPTLLSALGAAVPDDMDGRVRSDIFSPEFVSGNAVHYRDALAPAVVGETVSLDDEEQMRDKLRGLGYIE